MTDQTIARDENRDERTDGIQRLKPNAVGIVGVLFMAVATAAPITAMVGNVPIAVGFGNGSHAPAGYIVATVVLSLFAVGYAAMAKHPDNWYWWRWGGVAPIEVNTDIPLPTAPKFLELARRTGDERTAARLAEQFDVRAIVATAASPQPGDRYDSDSLTGPRLVLHDDGGYAVFLAEPDRRPTDIEIDSIKARADEAVQLLNADCELMFDGITATRHGGIGRDGTEVAEAIADYTAHYRQVHDGLPVLRGGDGSVSVTLDAAGSVCTLADRTVTVVGETEAGPPETEYPSLDRALAAAIDEIRDGLDGDKGEVELVSDSRDVGYRLDRDTAAPVVREAVEVRSGGFRIRPSEAMPYQPGTPATLHAA